MFRRMVAVPAALLVVLFTASIALGVTVPLKQGTDIDWNEAGVEVECDSDRPAVPSGMVEWHFVAHTTTSDFKLNAEFADGTTVVNKAADEVKDSYQLHWYITTSLTTLESASITSATGAVNRGGFNLSHVCPNPGEEIPEAPASVLLIASAAVFGAGFLLWKRREGTAIA